MSLNEIKGTGLGTKMGVKTTPVKTTVPYDLKASIVSSNVSSLVTKPSAITKQLTTAQKDAINAAYNRKMGISIIKSDAFQKVSGIVKAKVILGDIRNAGLEINPGGTGALLYTAAEQAASNRDALNLLSSQQQEWGAMQTDYISRISANETVLATATNKLGITLGQLETTQSKYLTLQEKYNELLNNPPSNPELPDLFGGLGDFLNKYGIWIALGVGALLFMPLISRLIPGGRE